LGQQLNGGSLGNESATDADEEIAASLIDKWDAETPDLAGEVISLLKAIRKEEIAEMGNMLVIGPSDSWGIRKDKNGVVREVVYNGAYFIPEHYHKYIKFLNDVKAVAKDKAEIAEIDRLIADYSKVLEGGYKIHEMIVNKFGFIPGWCKLTLSKDNSTIQVQEAKVDKKYNDVPTIKERQDLSIYSYDAVRNDLWLANAIYLYNDPAAITLAEDMIAVRDADKYGMVVSDDLTDFQMAEGRSAIPGHAEEIWLTNDKKAYGIKNNLSLGHSYLLVSAIYSQKLRLYSEGQISIDELNQWAERRKEWKQAWLERGQHINSTDNYYEGTLLIFFNEANEKINARIMQYEIAINMAEIK
ncbi:MAG: hypothetical protein ABIH39_06790, partial [Candidatus Margulisiibacteriota bacterium]